MHSIRLGSQCTSISTAPPPPGVDANEEVTGEKSILNDGGSWCGADVATTGDMLLCAWFTTVSCWTILNVCFTEQKEKRQYLLYYYRWQLEWWWWCIAMSPLRRPCHFKKAWKLLVSIQTSPGLNPNELPFPRPRLPLVSMSRRKRPEKKALLLNDFSFDRFESQRTSISSLPPGVEANEEAAGEKKTTSQWCFVISWLGTALLVWG